MPGFRFGSRTLARSQALQLLFQAQLTGRLVSDVLAGEFITSGDPSEDLVVTDGTVDPYARELAEGADGMLHELDAVLEANSANWGVSRMPLVDRNLLRLALYEMLVVDDVDISITIDEFVELAKEYGTDESSRFVNGLLGSVARKLEQGEDVVAEALASLPDEPEDADDEVPSDADDGEGGYDDTFDGFEEYEGADDYGYLDDPMEAYSFAEEASDVEDEDALGELPDWARED